RRVRAPGSGRPGARRPDAMQTEQPILNVRGEKVGLGPLRRENLPQLTRWMNDWDVTWTVLVGNRPITLEEEQRWFEGVTSREGAAIFHVYELSTLRLVGNCGLHDIDHKTGTAELGMVLGEKDCWGKGYATEASKLLLRYAFGRLGLNNVMLRA